MTWMPHATVAVIVEKDGRFLMVEELSQGEQVFNQPAGHIEANETILDAARREALEETGWEVEITDFLGLYTYTAPANGITYYRLCFAAQPLLKTEHPLDNDILAVHWLSLEELETLSNRLRSPLVRRCIDDYLTGLRLPLSAIVELS